MIRLRSDRVIGTRRLIDVSVDGCAEVSFVGPASPDSGVTITASMPTYGQTPVHRPSQYGATFDPRWVERFFGEELR